MEIDRRVGGVEPRRLFVVVERRDDLPAGKARVSARGVGERQRLRLPLALLDDRGAGGYGRLGSAGVAAGIPGINRRLRARACRDRGEDCDENGEGAQADHRAPAHTVRLRSALPRAVR